MANRYVKNLDTFDLMHSFALYNDGKSKSVLLVTAFFLLFRSFL